MGCSERAKIAPRGRQGVPDFQLSRLGLKQFSVTARFGKVEIASKGRSGLKIAHAVGFHPQARKKKLGLGLYSRRDDYQGLTVIFDFSRTTPKKHKWLVLVTQQSDLAQT